MAHEHKTFDVSRLGCHGTTTSYSIGFLLSLALTLAAYFLVHEHLLNGQMLVFTVVTLATLQVMTQLYFFLHVSTDPSERWNLLALLFMALIVLIIVSGSLWIMYHLDYNMMDTMSEKAMSDPDRIRIKG